MYASFNDHIQMGKYLIFTVLILGACSPQGPNQQAVELNDLAVEQLMTDPDSALTLLNQAIKIDPNYQIAYTNKLAVLYELGLNQEALRTALQFSRVKGFPTKKNVVVGIAYERVNNFVLARQYYSKALAYYYSDEWRLDPILSQLDFAILTTITRDKEIGMAVFRRVLGEAKFSEEETKLINLTMNEIDSYAGGGFVEFLDPGNVTEYCISGKDEKRMEEALSNLRVNYVGKSINGNNGEIRFRIKEKFKPKVKELGLQQCDQ